MKSIILHLSFLMSTFLFVQIDMNSQITSASLGSGTSSSATRGPFQRSNSGSSSVYSRANLVYTQAEVLSTLGITSGSTISQVNWDLGSTNIITATGDATMTIYMKNSSATDAIADSWTNIINGSTIVGSYTFNQANNFPGVEGFVAFPLDTDFIYNGGTLEIAVEWDCSALVPADPAQPNLLFSGNGSLNWHWDATTHVSLSYRAGSSSPPSQIQNNVKAERVNTQFVYTLPPSCGAPTQAVTNSIGTGTSSSSTRGPVQISGGVSTTQYSRFVQIYTAAELSTIGLTSGGSITDLAWDLVSENTITSGTGTFKVYIRNSAATQAVSDTWSNLISGSSLVVDEVFDAANNFPGVGGEGWLAFSFINPFTYTGGAVEIAVDWGFSIPTGSGFTNTDGDGIKWRWSSTAPDNLVVKKTSSSAPSTNISDLRNERANIQITYLPAPACDAPVNVSTSNLTSNAADLSWDAELCAISYNWIIVAAGAGPSGTVVASGSTTGITASATGLIAGTSYELYVQSDCGDVVPGPFSPAHPFMTVASGQCNGTQLLADATMNTYDLISSVLADPGGNPIEVPDCGHAAFGDHITQQFDTDLGIDVFNFHMHVHEDDDRCINFDRQRNEIKTYGNSPDYLLGVLGETVQYKWKFKLDAGFQPSSKFTHIHQLKSVGASNNEDDMPQITFTPRKGTPDKLELRYAEDLTQITWAEVDLTPFKGEWVEVTETVTYGDWGEGVYSVIITKVSDGSILLSYTNNSTRMWKTDASFVRPKWGIYRSLEDIASLRDEEVLFADFCIDEISTAPSCSAPPTFLDVTNISSSSADLIWGGVPGAITYNWKLVAAGAGANGPSVASGTTSKTVVSVTGLASLSSYDLHVEAVCGVADMTGYSAAYNFMTLEDTNKITTDAIGFEASSSSSRGPLHQAGTTASTRYSRFFHVFTEEELEDIALQTNGSITHLQWYITTSDVITGPGDAPLKIYIKNSSATSATEDTWANLTAGATLALNTTYNATNNFPGTAGWMSFEFDQAFVYTGDALEIAVEWDWSAVSFTNGGSIKWRYSNFQEDLVSRALGTVGYSTNLTYSTTSKQRANTKFCYEPAPPASCDIPSNVTVANVTTSTADLSWDAVSSASSYSWLIVLEGDGDDGTPVASGTSTSNTVVAIDLTCLTSYDLYVQANCVAGDMTAFSPAYQFVTLPPVSPSLFTIGTATNSSSSRGPIQQGGGTSSTRYSRFNQVFTQVELQAIGLTANSSITELQWYLNSTDIIAGSGDAPFKVYIKNSSATLASVDSWANITAGADLVVDRIFNTTNNFPGVTGWMPFTFERPFLYTGGAIEISVEWDYGSISIPAFTGSDASNPNGGSIKWRYSGYTDNLVVRALGSGSHSTSNLTFSTGSALPSERANIQMVFVPDTPCEDPCPLIREVDDIGIDDDIYRADQTVLSEGLVQTGGMVSFAAGECVILEEGFEVESATVFCAYIEDCQ